MLVPPTCREHALEVSILPAGFTRGTADPDPAASEMPRTSTQSCLMYLASAAVDGETCNTEGQPRGELLATVVSLHALCRF